MRSEHESGGNQYIDKDGWSEFNLLFFIALAAVFVGEGVILPLTIPIDVFATVANRKKNK